MPKPTLTDLSSPKLTVAPACASLATATTAAAAANSIPRFKPILFPFSVLDAARLASRQAVRNTSNDVVVWEGQDDAPPMAPELMAQYRLILLEHHHDHFCRLGFRRHRYLRRQ